MTFDRSAFEAKRSVHLRKRILQAERQSSCTSTATLDA